MKKHQNHYDYESVLELHRENRKQYNNAKENLKRQRDDLYRWLYGRYRIIWHILRWLLYIWMVASLVLAWYWLSSYLQKENTTSLSIFNLMEIPWHIITWSNLPTTGVQ